MNLSKINDSVCVSVYNSTKGIIWIFIIDSVRFSVRNSVRFSVRNSVGSPVGRSVGSSVKDSVKDYFQIK
jgi:hypothetical protein